jgi:iron complex transport system ATP-binding protein
MEPVLAIEGVYFRYLRQWVLQDIGVEVGPGDLVAVLGPNGSGKSTLLRIADGLARPQKGAVRIKGRPVERYGRRALAREVAMVPQENHFSFSFSVLEVVLMGRFPHLGSFGFEGKKDMDVALEALSSTRALHLSHRPINELSGGEKGRVLLARALAQEPSVILLDEPTAFLDLKYKKEIFDLVSSLTGERGLSAVVVTHDIDLAARYCNRVVMLKEGRLYASGSPSEVVTASNIEKVYGCRVVVDRNPATGSPRVSVI